MAQRGRKSASALMLPTVSVEVVKRPDAPYDLTDEQSQEWWAIVNRMPADWFPRETHSVLSQLCRHIVNARRVAQLIDAEMGADKLSVDVYEQLLRMQARESGAIASLSTKLRITQQSTYDKSKKKPTLVQKPWEPNDPSD
jgi:hypothetical protein